MDAPQTFEREIQLEHLYIKTVLPLLLPNCGDEVVSMTHRDGPDLQFDFNNKIFNGTSYKLKSNTFVHFTSLKALHSILNENALRLYCMNSLNDPNEYGYYINEAFIEIGNIDKIKENTFVLSMCYAQELEEDNALNLWRLYGDNGNGVAIVFEINLPNVNEVEELFIGKVLYKKPKLKPFFQKNIEYEKATNQKINVLELMRIPACFHKDAAFKIENEIRLMHFDRGASITAQYDPTNGKYFKDFNSRRLCCMNLVGSQIFPIPFRPQATFTDLGAAI
jgi:hypothetical protein